MHGTALLSSRVCLTVCRCLAVVSLLALTAGAWGDDPTPIAITNTLHFPRAAGYMPGNYNSTIHAIGSRYGASAANPHIGFLGSFTNNYNNFTTTNVILTNNFVSNFTNDMAGTNMELAGTFRLYPIMLPTNMYFNPWSAPVNYGYTVYTNRQMYRLQLTNISSGPGQVWNLRASNCGSHVVADCPAFWFTNQYTHVYTNGYDLSPLDCGFVTTNGYFSFSDNHWTQISFQWWTPYYAQFVTAFTLPGTTNMDVPPTSANLVSFGGTGVYGNLFLTPMIKYPSVYAMIGGLEWQCSVKNPVYVEWNQARKSYQTVRYFLPSYQWILSL